MDFLEGVQVQEYMKEDTKDNLNKAIKKSLTFLKDAIHAFLLCFLLYGVLRAVIGVQNHVYTGEFFADLQFFFNNMGINEIYTFVGAIAFILFGVVGVYEFAYVNGIYACVPSLYIKVKQDNYIKQAEKMMKHYYAQDIEFIQEYEKERTSYMLQAMGLEEKQFHHINYEIVKARTQMARSIFALRCKAERILMQKEFVQNQLEIPKERRVYEVVDYFFNLNTTMYDPQICECIGDLMSCFLRLTLEQDVDKIDYIVIPYGSNLLMGLEVGKKLNKKVLQILENGRIDKEKPWDGEYDENKVNNIVVLHDVLVSGERVYKSIGKLKAGSYNLLGIFCTAKYNNTKFRAIEEFKAHGIAEKNIHCLLEVDKDSLRKVYRNKYEYRYEWK